MRNLRTVFVFCLVALFLVLSLSIHAQQEKLLETVLIEPGSSVYVVLDNTEEKGYFEKVIKNEKSYRMAKYPITQSQYEEIMGYNPSFFEGDNKPVESLSLYDALMFCNKLSEQKGLVKAYKLKDIAYGEDGNTIIEANIKEREWADGYRLPGYTQWVYAATGGPETELTVFPGSNKEDEVAWYRVNSDKANSSLDDFNNGGTMPIGQKKPNPYGLYDMAGNVYEYVNEMFENGDTFVVGGGWYANVYELVIGYGARARPNPNPTARKFIGFRPIRYVESLGE